MSASYAARLHTPVASAALDALLVLLFAAVGHRAHDEGGALTGVLVTAWPFLAGTVVGWLIVRAGRGDWPVSTGPGLTVWFATLVFGMVLRRVMTLGTAPSFILVAALVLGLFLVGRRVLLDRLSRGQEDDRGSGGTTHAQPHV